MANKRKLQAEQTRQKIIETMQQLVFEKPYDDITVDDISNACGIGRGTLYHYFKSKDDIFNYLQRGRFDTLVDELDADGLGTIEDKLRRYCTLWFEHILQDSVNLSAHWYRQALSHALPESEGRRGNHFDDDIANISSYLEESVASGELVRATPVELIATDIVFSINGATFYRCIDEQGFDLKGWSEGFIDHVLALHVTPFKAKHK